MADQPRLDGVRRSRSGAPALQQATVRAVIDEALDAVTVRLRLRDPSGFLPGQYYNVRVALPGRPRPAQRAYSVGSSPLPDPSLIDLGVRKLPGGLLSPVLAHLRVGDVVAVRGLYGRVTWDGGDAWPVLLVGAGSGIVPLMSMVRHAAQRGQQDPLVLICSASTHSHTLNRDDLAVLTTRHSWLQVVHCITRDPAEPHAHYHRRVDRTVLSETLELSDTVEEPRSIEGIHPCAAYLCGRPVMVESVAASIVYLAAAPNAIRKEKYD